LQVAVDDAVVVGGFEGFGDLHGDLGGLLQTERILPEPLGERLALDVLHGDELASLGLSALVHLADERVVQPRGGLGLEDEAIALAGIEVHSPGRELQGHVALQALVAGEEHLGHAPAPEDLDDPIGAECLGAGHGPQARGTRGTMSPSPNRPAARCETGLRRGLETGSAQHPMWLETIANSTLWSAERG